MSRNSAPIWPPIAARLVNDRNERSVSRSRSPSRSRNDSQSQFEGVGTGLIHHGRRDSFSISQAPILKDEIHHQAEDNNSHAVLFKANMQLLANEFDPSGGAAFQAPEEGEGDVTKFNFSLLHSNKNLIELEAEAEEEKQPAAEPEKISTLELARPGFATSLGRSATFAQMRKIAPHSIHTEEENLKNGSNNIFLARSRSLKRLVPLSAETVKAKTNERQSARDFNDSDSGTSSSDDDILDDMQFDDEQFLVQDHKKRKSSKRGNPWKILYKKKRKTFDEQVNHGGELTSKWQKRWNSINSYVLMPNSYFISIQYWLSILFIVYQLMMLPWTAFFQPELLRDSAILATDYLIDFWFLIETIFIRRNLGFYNDWQQLETDLRIIRRDCLYEQGILWDVVGLIPLELFAFIDFEFAFGTKSHGLYRLIRLFRVRRLFSHRLDSVHFYLRFLKLSIIGLLVIHIMACFIYGFGNSEPIINFDLKNTNDTGLTAQNIFQIPWIQRVGINEADLLTRYMTSFYWIVVTFLTLGYGDISPSTNAEKFIVCFILVSGVMFTSILLSIISMLIANSDRSAVRLESGLDEIDGIFRAYSQLPAELGKELQRQHKSLWRVHRGFDMNEVLDELPPKFNSRTKLFLHASLVQKVPWFSKSGTGFLIDIVRRLRPVLFLADEYIFKQGDAADCMYFLATGHARIFRMELKQKSEEQKSLESAAEVKPDTANPFSHPKSAGLDDFNIVFDKFVFPGMFFGELGIMFLEPRAASVLTVTNCEVCVLSKFDFKDVLHMHPKSAIAVIREAKTRKRMDRLRDKKRNEMNKKKPSEVPMQMMNQEQTMAAPIAAAEAADHRKLSELRKSSIHNNETAAENPSDHSLQTPAAPIVHGSLRKLHDVHEAEFAHPHAIKPHQSTKAQAMILLNDLNRRLGALESKIAQHGKLEKLLETVERKSHSAHQAIKMGNESPKIKPKQESFIEEEEEAEDADDEEEVGHDEFDDHDADADEHLHHAHDETDEDKGHRREMMKALAEAEDSGSDSEPELGPIIQNKTESPIRTLGLEPRLAVSITSAESPPAGRPAADSVIDISPSMSADTAVTPPPVRARKIILKPQSIDFQSSLDTSKPIPPSPKLPPIAVEEPKPQKSNIELGSVAPTAIPSASNQPDPNVTAQPPQRRKIRLSIGGGTTKLISPTNNAETNSKPQQARQEEDSLSMLTNATASSGGTNGSPTKKKPLLFNSDSAPANTSRPQSNAQSPPLSRIGSATGNRSTMFARVGGAAMGKKEQK